MKRFYPAILEQGPKKTFAVWFPDFPDCVAAGHSQEQALEKAEGALARAAAALQTEQGHLPEPTPFDRITFPKGCKPITMLAVGLEAPDPSERVNIYLPKRILARADKRAAELGMSRSSYFGLAISVFLDPAEVQTAEQSAFVRKWLTDLATRTMLGRK